MLHQSCFLIVVPIIALESLQGCGVNEADGNAMLCRRLGAGGKLRGLLQRLAPKRADFDGNGAVFCVHRTVMAFQLEPLHGMAADAEGARLAEDQLGKGIGLMLVCENFKDPS